MKTNFGLAVIVKTPDPIVGDILHLALYEEYPTQNDVDAFIEELRTDENFGMTDQVCDVDYFLQDLCGEKLKEVKASLEIPEEFENDKPPCSPAGWFVV